MPIFTVLSSKLIISLDRQPPKEQSLIFQHFSVEYIANSAYLITTGDVIMLYVINRDLFVAPIKIKLL